MKKLLTLILALMATTATLFAESGSCGENVNWDLTGGVLTISGTGDMYHFATMAPWYTMCKSITSVIIEDGVTNISYYAFNSCSSMTSVTIPNSVTSIGKQAFYGCSALTSITLPTSLESIYEEAFYGCSGLTSLTLPASLKSIGNKAFYNCSGLTEITCEATTPPACEYTTTFLNLDNSIPVKVPDASVSAYKIVTGWNYFTNIQGISGGISSSCGENVNWVLKDGVLTISGTGPMEDYPKETDAPWYSERESITSVIIENGVTTVGRKAFMYYSTITSITLPESLTAIGDDAFRAASIESITIPANVASIGNLIFRNCTLLKTINVLPTTPPTLGTLPFSNIASDYVIYVPAAAFGAYKTADGWKDLNIQTEGGSSSGTCGENVNWELIGGVLTISGTGDMADYASQKDVPWYDNHADIYTVTIGNGVTTIGKNAFYDCINVTSATIPSSVTTIKDYGFFRCTGLTKITCEATTPPTLKTNVFYEIDRSIPVYVPKGYISAYQAADDWNEFTNIQAIPDGTFGPCGENVNFDLTDGVLTISGSGPMTDYKSSSNVPWRSARESITSIVIENSVTSIGSLAFYKCIQLPSVTIPSSITSIGKSALESCTGLKEITCEATTPPTCGADAFFNINTSIPVYVPTASVGAYQAADGWSEFTNILGGGKCGEHVNWALKDGVLTISGTGPMDDYSGKAAIPWYDERKSIVSVIIEDGVTSIGKHAFNECINIASVQIAQTITSIGNYAFRKCAALTSLTIPAAVKSIGKQAFLDCSGLTEITCEAVTPPTLNDDVFSGVDNSIPVHVPAGCMKAYQNAEGWNYFNNIQTFSSIEVIDGINYFLDGSDLTAQVFDLSGDKYVGDIVLPEKVKFDKYDFTVTSINSEAFTNSPELLSVSLPKTVNWIEPGSFLRNPKLTAINVAPANTTYSSLDGVLFNTVQTELIAYPTGRAGAYVVPDGVEIILDEAFTDNANLTAITLPASLIEIASLAFDECTGLTAITSKAVNAPAAGSDAFQKVSKSIPVYVPQKGLASYKAEYEWKDFTNFIAIEDKAAADAVIVKIEAIGAVAYTTECKDRIDAARNAYDALTAEQKALVPAEKLAILTAAEKAYADLKAQAEADQAAANIVIGKIDAIGTVTLSSEPAIVAARQAYDALTDAQKALVTNYAVLTAAEVKLEILKKQAESDAAAAAAVTDLINGIGTVTYTTECKERIDAAREAYNALTDAQKALVTNLGTLTAAEKAYADLKAKAEADQATADIVIGKINAIGVVSYSEASKALIDDARAAYDALTDAQKGLIPAATYKVLTDAEQAYADLKAKAAADLAAANIVITKIDAIGSVTLSSEPAIVDARAAYNALTTDQKALVTNYATLVAAEKALADLKAKAAADQAAADNVIAEINAIGTVTLSSEPAIVAARAAYNALTADQKALVTNLSTLTAAEAKLDQLKKQAAADQAAADLVIGKINAIGTVSYSEASKALIDAARTAYDALTAAQQALVTNLATLTAAEKAYADLKAKAEADQAAANTVIAQIDAIGEVTLASEPAIVAARSAYNALTADQKALVSNYNVLTAAEAKLEVLKKQAESDEAAAAAVSNLISGIGTVTYTTECKARIDAAREAYDALTDVQKALVTNLATLTAAEKAYADLKAKAEADQAAATAVIGKINAIGEVTLASEPAIVAARSAYNALTADQKALVSNYSVLTAAEAKLEVLKQQAEADQAAATAVIGKINAIGTVAYDEASKARIDDARHAYDALTAAQKALVTNYGVLTAAEQAYADLKAQAEVIAAAKQQLVDLVSEATALKAVAAMYAPSAVGEIEAIIASAQATINDPNATLEEINMKYDNLQYDFELEANKLLEEAKEQLKQSIRALYQPGDYPSWYASAIIPALDQVDAITWDFSMTVQENILLFQATGQTLYNNAKKALEDLRAKDTRELVSSCTFTGFADAIQLDMTWNIKALNELINTLNASVAAEPYRLDAEMSSLGKWDPVNKELIILDPYEAQKLTAGDYQFITAVKIDGEDAKQYRLPKATEEVLSVTVDATVWAVDLSGIVIDATYSYTYVTSPMFTISKSEDVELVNEAPIKTQKIYHNGHFYILRGEHIYDLQGTLVK